MTELLEHMARLMAAQMQADIDAAIHGAYSSPSGLGSYRIDPMGGTFIANDHERPQPPLTSASIRESMQRLERELGPPPPPFKIVESWFALKQVRRRAYPKRKAKSVSHWRRMDKKWLKRYGFRQVPTMFKANTSWITGRPGLTLFVHPELTEQLYAALEQKALQP